MPVKKVVREPTPIDPIAMLRPRRAITGITAVYLPHDELRRIDWNGFEGLLARTAEAGLTPAVNMDTGFVDQLSARERSRVLERTRVVLGGSPFVAGAFVDDTAEQGFQPDLHKAAIDEVQAFGGTPVIFPCHGLGALADDALVAAHEELARHADRFIAFELGTMFVPFGRIFTLDAYAAIMAIPQCIGAKHSSLSREEEWQRLLLRDELRPEFHVFTGNDLAIDMVMYGSDYLLGLAACAPDLFARRDAWWKAGDVRFYELNDGLQALGSYVFRAPVPGYKHNVAQFLHRRGWIEHSEPHRNARRRPKADEVVIHRLAERLGVS